MQKVLILVVVLLVFSNLKAQSFISPPSAIRHESLVVDSGYFRVLYAMNAVDINDTKTYDDLQRLEIGLNSSKYYSYFVFSNDSLAKVEAKKNSFSGGAPTMAGGKWGKNGYKWSLLIWSFFYKDFSKHSLSEQALMPWGVSSYDYTEEMPVQDWILEDDTLKVCGYLCQKATCHFRGREFVAWFTTEIPISNGPWKFGGLPGLILKVNDIDLLYTFEGIKVENLAKKFPILMYDNKTFQRFERTKLRALEKEIYSNYFKVAGITNTDQNGTPRPFIPISYHPLELE